MGKIFKISRQTLSFYWVLLSTYCIIWLFTSLALAWWNNRSHAGILYILITHAFYFTYLFIWKAELQKERKTERFSICSFIPQMSIVAEAEIWLSCVNARNHELTLDSPHGFRSPMLFLSSASFPRWLDHKWNSLDCTAGSELINLLHQRPVPTHVFLTCSSLPPPIFFLSFYSQDRLAKAIF